MGGWGDGGMGGWGDGGMGGYVDLWAYPRLGATTWCFHALILTLQADRLQPHTSSYCGLSRIILTPGLPYSPNFPYLPLSPNHPYSPHYPNHPLSHPPKHPHSELRSGDARFGHVADVEVFVELGFGE